MVLDVRATVSSSLGDIIAGNISDDYVQGVGLVKTRGSITINGIVTPTMGDIVTLTYTKNGITLYIPRKLRVLSSFADPYRRITQVELGCKLTYYSDLSDPVKWNAEDEDDYNAADKGIIPPLIYASSVANKCLSALGIQLETSPIPLTNRFQISEFDFSSPYVNILSDLLVSECYCGYLTFDEKLKIINLNQEGGTGPVLDSPDIIDIGPLNFGELPGENVIATYSYRSLDKKQIEKCEGDETSSLWSSDRVSMYEQVKVPYNVQTAFLGVQTNIQTYYVYTTITTETTNRDTSILIRVPVDSDNPDGLTTIKWKKVRLLSKRVVTESTGSIKYDQARASRFLESGKYYGSYSVEVETTESYEYDIYGKMTEKTTIKKVTPVIVVAGLPVSDWVFEDGAGGMPDYYTDSNSGISIVVEKKVEEWLYYADQERKTESDYTYWPLTQVGQQGLGAVLGRMYSAYDLGLAIDQILSYGDLVLTGYRQTTRKVTEKESVPETVDTFNSDVPINQLSKMTLVSGTASATRRKEFSVPYSSDDYVTKSGSGPCPTYSSQSGDAATKAYNFGKAQNRLLQGNRLGISIQTAPEKIPNRPFEPVFILANGYTALYRTNGTNYTFDQKGLIIAVDALFWGAIGGSEDAYGDFWFPVASGITTLPETPPSVDTTPLDVLGTVTTVGTAPNTTLNTAFPGAIEGDAVIDASTGDYWISDGAGSWTNIGPNPGATLTTDGVVPISYEVKYLDFIQTHELTVETLDYSLDIQVTIDISLNYSVEYQGASVSKPSAFSVDFSATVPTVPAGLWITRPSRVNANLAANVPSVGRFIGVYAECIAADTAIQALAPTRTTGSAATLLLHMDGTNGSTTFTDSSPIGNIVTANGNAQISTVQSKFGGASALFDGTGDYLSIANTTSHDLAGDFTVEAWVYVSSFATARTIAGKWGAAGSRGWRFDINSATSISFTTANSGTTGTVYTVTVPTLSVDTWYHIAVSRLGTNLRFFVNGTQAGTTQTGVSANNTATTPTAIGINIDGLITGFSGYIDELRITQGVAWYTANFTAPTSPFP